MIAKWICVPYGILVIVIACYTKCVIPDYLSSYSMWYSSYEDYSILEYALIFGVFGGIITGLAADILNQRVCLIIASILALVSYCLVPYFDGSSRDKHKEWHYYVLLVLMFMAGQSASLATISTVKINLKNFNVTVAPLIISILLSYFYMGIHIESSIRWSLLFGIDTKVYLLGVGIASFVIYAVGAIILTFDQGAEQHSIESQYYLAMLDKIGCSIFIIYEVFLMLLLMLFKLILKNVYAATWVCMALLFGNFLIPIINAECILSKANQLLLGYSPDPKELRKILKAKDKSSFASFESFRIIGLLLISLVLIGSGSEIFERLSNISHAMSMGYLTEYTMIWYIFGDFINN